MAVKLVLLLGLVAEAAVVVAVVGLSRLAESTDDIHSISRNNVDQLTRIGDVADAANGAFIWSGRAALAVDATAAASAYSALNSDVERLRRANAAYREHAIDDHARRTSEQIGDLADQYALFQSTQLKPLAVAGRDADWYRVNRQSTLGAQLDDVIASAHDREVDAARAAHQRADLRYQQQRVVITLTLVVSLSVTLALAFMAARRIARRLAQVRNVAVRLGVRT